jgi:hypothetical protein
MGLGLEAVLGYNGDLTGSTTFDALTPGVNQSFTIRNFASGRCFLEELWASDTVGAYTLSVHSPKMHDDVYGILLSGTPLNNAGAVTFNPQTLMEGDTVQEVFATDTLSFSANGTASDVFAALMLFRYENISGIDARLYSWAAIKPLIVDYAGVQVSPETSGTAGHWGTPAALNSGLYRLKANTDYAILGYTVSTPCVAVVINGIDTGNLNVGGPGFWAAGDGNDYFRRMSLQYGLPHIPVVNSNNAPNITVNVADVKTSVTVKVTLLLAQLSQLLPNPSGG